jgi:RimJ/RimL family protein N-acetyltransferase
MPLGSLRSPSLGSEGACGDASPGNIVSWPAEEKRLVGYWIGKTFWGKGVASDALEQFTRVDRRRPLHAIIAEHNVASRRVLEKAGFRVVGAAIADDGPDGVPFKELHLVLDAAAA